MSRHAEAVSFDAYVIDRPFSLFDFAEKYLGATAPIRRFLTLGRQRNAVSLVVESVPAASSVESENEAIRRMYPDYVNQSLLRVSFWKKSISTPEDLEGCDDQDCVGYALFKQDVIPSENVDRWQIFESVVRKYPHPHNYSRVLKQLSFRVGGKEFSIPGCLYAQQNTFNKACAQVALRSLIATRLADPDVSCEQINEYAREVGAVVPGKGLNTAQISHVLDKYNIPHVAIDYVSSPDLKVDFPYEKLVYSGIESGAGALLAFGMSGPQAPSVGHIIPCYGHTFNEDAWGPQAESAYFRIGESIRYIPSRAWCSSFIAHDDNFGANLCIPMSLLNADQVVYAVELLPDGYAYSGAEAEVASADYFYSLLPQLPSEVILDNAWVGRLIDYVFNQQLILRSVSVSRDAYISSLKEARDWSGAGELDEVVESLARQLPPLMWMVEVTVPEIFSTNKRKLGEILLDAGKELKPEIDGESFLLARFPESYVFFDQMSGDGNPSFLTVQSALKSHTALWGGAD